MSNPEYLLLLLDRPNEPAFTPKGNGKYRFDLPESYVPDRFRPAKERLQIGQGDDVEVIPVKEVDVPKLGRVVDLGRDENFSVLIPRHRELATDLINIFLDKKWQHTEDFLSVAAYCRDRVNSLLYNFALITAILNRPDTGNMDIPPLTYVFPGKFFDHYSLYKAREEAEVLLPADRKPIEIAPDFTATKLEPEQRVAYFRENVALNAHHWHWHLLYPFDGPIGTVKKDRRGELFYYMHQQIVARYNFERFSNDLARVQRFSKWTDSMQEGYFPKLTTSLASRNWPGRPPHLTLQDLYRDSRFIDVDDLYKWRDRISGAIQAGYVFDRNGVKVDLCEKYGIDILGDIVEASSLSLNPELYGNLHNSGHLLISHVHDPDRRFLEDVAVMGDEATAMRDPIFYRWHAFIDALFREHKNRLPSYRREQLEFGAVSILSLEIQRNGDPITELNTYWQKSDLDIKGGLDFAAHGSVYVRVTHLQHEPFMYLVKVYNGGAETKGTVRIFLAPKYDDNGNEWQFRHQKNFFIELDRFVVMLKKRENTIVRESSQSNVTISDHRIFRDIEFGEGARGGALGGSREFCDCGWPHHLLIPKGKCEGLPCQLFVMISDYEEDSVDQEEQYSCEDAQSYCGRQGSVYPDRRPMGYPFDRIPREGVDTIAQFLTPNMFVIDCSIKHTNRVEEPKG